MFSSDRAEVKLSVWLLRFVPLGAGQLFSTGQKQVLTLTLMTQQQPISSKLHEGRSVMNFNLLQFDPAILTDRWLNCTVICTDALSSL